MVVKLASDTTLLIEVAETPSISASLAVHAVRARLLKATQKSTDHLPPIRNLQLGYCSVLVDLDPLSGPYGQSTEEQFQNYLTKSITFSEDSPKNVIEIPVAYGGPNGEDLTIIAEAVNKSESEIIGLHSSPEYLVSFIGFSPGFPYLLGLPPELHTKRKGSPRTRVPAGSVAIAANQAGIYPSVTSGGWNLIGRTSFKLFDPTSYPPTALQPGDRVRFKPIKSDLNAPLAAANSQQPTPSYRNDRSNSSGDQPRACDDSDSISPTCMTILELPQGSSVQDQGRFRLADLGISPGGAADLVAHSIGQKLVGNTISAASLEVIAGRSLIRFEKDTWVAVTGAAVDPKIDGLPIKMWTALPVCAGQMLELNEPATGFRSYVSVHGGIGGPLLLNSRGSHTTTGFGGPFGAKYKPLEPLDSLPAGSCSEMKPTFRRANSKLAEFYSEFSVLRIIPGLQFTWFDALSVSRLEESEFTVTSDIDRSGVRLSGSPIPRKPEFSSLELVSEGVTQGSIQITSNGQPVFLYCEHPITGGYPKIATVIRADLFKLGQLHPGAKIRFQWVSVDEAWTANQQVYSLMEASIDEF